MSGRDGSGPADGPEPDGAEHADGSTGWGESAEPPEADADVGLLAAIQRRFPALLMARRNLSRNKLRSALAALGIIIGVLAIASLGMFGTTLRTGANQSLGDIGNELQVTPNQFEGFDELTDRDVTAIERAADSGSVVPIREDQVRIERGDEASIVTVYGMENPAALYEAESGRVPDRLRRGAVVGSFLAERFDLEAGNSITVGNKTYRVAAVLREQEGFSLVSADNAVILPPGEVGDGRGYDRVIVTAESATAANATAREIEADLNDREERVSVFELSSITEGIGQFFGILNAFLIGIGSISLVVAGVSILNVMLMSTVERREEIGVLRAVGVQRLDVVRMILSEAALLGAIGGLFGAVLALGAGMALNAYVLSDWTVTFRPINVGYVALAFGFALVTSVLSGLYPAWKAANEQPVDALRS
jgi:putative ABC transport system permease protein